MKKLIFVLLLLCALFALPSCFMSDPCEDGHILRTERSEPTCCNEGYVSEYCAVCGKETQKTWLDKIAHEPDGEWYVRDEPTCSHEGKRVRYCNICGETIYEESIPKIPHELRETYTKPTCSKEGRRMIRCGVCWETVVDETVPKLAHTLYGEPSITKYPTCTSEGKTERRCSVCYEIAETGTLEMVNHKPGEWIVTVDYTCTKDGTKVQKCTGCSKILETATISAGHRIVTLDAVAPTCSSAGLTEGSKCSACGEVFVKQNEVTQLEHDFRKVASVAPTCTAYGYTEGTRCIHCEEWEVEPTQIDKISHSIVTVPGKAATCTNTGLTDGSKCSVCKTVIKSQTTLRELGHSYSVYNNTCDRCPEKQYEEVDTTNELRDADNASRDYVIYLDKCVNVNETNVYWVFTVGVDCNYIRLVGTPDVNYNFRIVVDSARKNSFKLDLVNVSLQTLIDKPIIDSNSKANIELGLYGEKCLITGKKGADGKNNTVFDLSTPGKSGSDAINIEGDIVITMAAEYAEIKGGNGGKGGNGRLGTDGENGGDGAYAVKASSITVKGADGYSSKSLILVGGVGGDGGTGGSYLIGKGDDGNPGKSKSATSVTVTYQ